MVNARMVPSVTREPTFPEVFVVRRQRVNAAAIAFALVALAMSILPSRASAQIGIEDLLGSVTDIDVSASCWATRSASLRSSDCPGGRNGYGVEVLWSLKTIHLGPAPRVDTTWVPSQKTVTVRGGRPDTITTLVMKEEEAETTGWRLLIELALGYSQFSGFRSADERYDLRGTEREQPSLAFYGSLNGPGILRHLSPYLGVRWGLIRLSDVQLFTPAEGDETTAYTGHAEVFQVGGALGIAVVGALQFGRIESATASALTHGQLFSLATETALRFNLAAFLVVLALFFLLPAAQPRLNPAIAAEHA